MNTRYPMGPPPPFAAQRIVFLALLLGPTMFAVVAGVVLQTNDGKGMSEEPLEILDTVSIALGAAAAIGAFAVRAALRKMAAGKQGDDRKRAMFASRLVPLAILEGASLFGIVIWMLNGNAVPPLAVAMVVLAIAIAITPFSDPDAGVR